MEAGNQKTQRTVCGRLNRGLGRRFTLRMAPMIDIIFLLLIFFLVAARWRPAEDFLPLQLPAAQAQTMQLGKPEPLTIHIFATQTGCTVQIAQLRTVEINQRTIETDLSTLREKLNKTLAEQKRLASDPIEIICAEDVKWQYLARVYNLFFAAALTDITFTMTQ